MSDFKRRESRKHWSPEEQAGIVGKGAVMAATGAAVPKTSPSQSTGERREVDRPVLTGSQIVCRALEDEGVDTVFGYPGGAVIPLYDALPAAGFHHVLVRFEQWAALAAEGYARATGKPGVCLATSGPGATNLVTGLADAMLDSVPIVAITGQVIQPLIGRDAFQEVDITGITLPVTKHNYLVNRIQDLAPTIKEAFHLATSGRPGPVLIDIPKTLFLQKHEYDYPETVYRRGYQPTSVPNMRQVRLAAEAIKKARKPLIMAGHGIMLSGATELFRDIRREDRHSGRIHAARSGHVPRIPSARPGPDGHARPQARQRCPRRVRSAHQHRRALRRSGDRSGQRFRAKTRSSFTSISTRRRSGRTCGPTCPWSATPVRCSSC